MLHPCLIIIITNPDKANNLTQRTILPFPALSLQRNFSVRTCHMMFEHVGFNKMLVARSAHTVILKHTMYLDAYY